MTDPRTRIPTMEWRALPSEAMMVCLRRLDEVGGYLHHSGMFKGRGYTIVKAGAQLYWYPTRSVRGLMTRGLVDDRGYITETGRQVARTNSWKEAP